MPDSASIATVGVVGLGFLGRGIAACLLGNGLRVVAWARRPETREQAEAFIGTAVDEMIEHGVAPASLAQTWRSQYSTGDDFHRFATCDVIIESVIEDLEAKEQVFQQLEAIVAPSVPIATNTSALPISLLQQKRRHPERLIGMHWAEPCYVTRFLEIICGEKTAEATLERVLLLARMTGKEPSVLRHDIEGFIVNRIGYAMYREAFHLLESGVADVETIDRSFRNAVGLWASISGPFRWMDLTGLPAYASVMKRLFPQLCNDQTVPETLTKLAESGADGIKNGRGFYNYTKEEAQRWEQLLHEHAWEVRAWMNQHFPLRKP